MKSIFYSLSLLSISSALYAKNIQPYDSEYLAQYQEEEKAAVLSQEMKVAYLTKILAQREKSYEEKISFLETELRKTKDRLIEKSLNQEKIEEATEGKEKYIGTLLNTGERYIKDTRNLRLKIWKEQLT